MRDARGPYEGGGRPAPGPALREPDISLCHARRSGLGDHVDCLVDYPGRCPHSLYFGSCCFCMHPRRKEIAARTEALGHDRGLATVA